MQQLSASIYLHMLMVAIMCLFWGSISSRVLSLLSDPAFFPWLYPILLLTRPLVLDIYADGPQRQMGFKTTPSLG